MYMHDVCYHTESVFIYTGNNRDIHYTEVLAKHMRNSGGAMQMESYVNRNKRTYNFFGEIKNI